MATVKNQVALPCLHILLLHTPEVCDLKFTLPSHQLSAYYSRRSTHTHSLFIYGTQNYGVITHSSSSMCMMYISAFLLSTRCYCSLCLQHRPRSHYDNIGNNDKIGVIFSAYVHYFRCRTGDVVAPLEPTITTATAVMTATKLASSQICMLESQDNQISNKNDLTALLRG